MLTWMGRNQQEDTINTRGQIQKDNLLNIVLDVSTLSGLEIKVKIFVWADNFAL